MSAYHEAELAVDFGGLTNLKVSHPSISVEGKVGLRRNRSKRVSARLQPSIVVRVDAAPPYALG